MQAVVDGVDVLTLSIGPDAPPEDTITFLNIFDIVMLFARRAGLFVVQAAGNQGPAPSTVVSFSPWAVGVAACTTDRSYPATLILGNGDKIGGVGLSGQEICYYWNSFDQVHVSCSSQHGFRHIAITRL